MLLFKMAFTLQLLLPMFYLMQYNLTVFLSGYVQLSIITEWHLFIMCDIEILPKNVFVRNIISKNVYPVVQKEAFQEPKV